MFREGGLAAFFQDMAIFHLEEWLWHVSTGTVSQKIDYSHWKSYLKSICYAINVLHHIHCLGAQPVKSQGVVTQVTPFSTPLFV
jgi:hypothetical protein